MSASNPHRALGDDGRAESGRAESGRVEAGRAEAIGVAESPAGSMAAACVFGPSLFATVTIETAAGDGEDQTAVHFHPGGQAFWIARMVNHLGERCSLVSPVGGEAGVVLMALTPTWDVDLAAVPTAAESAAYLHDRRDGSRREIATSLGGTLSRHEIDDLYGRVLEVSTATKMCVVTGSPTGRALGHDFYRRLGSDLAELEVVTIGDLHGAELDAFLDGGHLDVLKVSHEDLIDDGRLAEDHELTDRVEIGHELCGRGADIVVVSDPAGALLVARDGDVWYAEPPVLDAVDHRGAGDAMTAAFCVATLRHQAAVDMLRFACAAGAATVARHGLANAERDVIEALVANVQVRHLDAADSKGGAGTSTARRERDV
jgi:1-phosphofructokinase